MTNSRRNFLRQASAFGTLILLKPEIMFSAKQHLPNILIIGDSISIGYTPFVQDILKGRANVSHPAENCQGTTKGVEKINEWLGSVRWDVIHFNFGLHDLKHVNPATGENSTNPNDPLQADIKKYVNNLEFIIKRMKSTGARLIFATTTPVPENTKIREAGIEIKYNKAALKLIEKYQITVNDLYAFSLPVIKENQLPENVHFSPEGYKIIAEKVAVAILKELHNN